MAPAANGRAAISVDQEGDRAMEKAAADKTAGTGALAQASITSNRAFAMTPALRLR
jgi:hypothetical protein